MENRDISGKKLSDVLHSEIKPLHVPFPQGFAPTIAVGAHTVPCMHTLSGVILHILHVLASDQSATKILGLLMLMELHNRCKRWPPFIHT